MHIHAVATPGAEWDAFVEGTPGANLGHAAAWARVVKNAYGLAPYYLAARDEADALVGILPLVRFRGLRGKLELVSMPFLDSGGVLATSPEVERALLDAAAKRARDLGAQSVELRQLAPLTGGPEGDGLNRVDLAMPLETDEETQWKALRAKVRNQTRKAEKEGLELMPGTSSSLIDAFYDPFAVNMRDLGSPVHGRGFFGAMVDAFGNRLRIVATGQAGRSVGGLIAIDYADIVTVPWASTLRSERRRCPNNQIYWEALRWAIERGAREFDFGRSPLGSGTYKFKKGWGAEERPMAWCRLDTSGAFLPTVGIDENSTLKKLSEYWTRLPLALTATLGPRLRKHISH